MRRVFQIRGVTGAGKTTAMRGLLRSSGTPITRRVRTAHGIEEFTKSGTLSAVGNYNAKGCVGCDRMKGRKPIIETVQALIKSGEENVGLESMIFSTTFKMSSDLSKIVSAAGYEFMLVFLDVDFATALERVQERNGGKPISIGGLERRIDSYERSRDKCIESGMKSIRIDATKTRQRVLEELKRAVL